MRATTRPGNKARPAASIRLRCRLLWLEAHHANDLRAGFEFWDARLFLIPHRDVSAFLAYRAWWMADATAPWIPAGLSDPTVHSSDFMGQTVEFATRWDPHDNVALEAGWTALIKGEFARNAPGAPADHSNVNYFYVQSEIRF